METNYPFKKIQVAVSINENLSNTNQISNLSIEVGYPNSSGEYVWKGSSRVLNNIEQKFLKTTNRNDTEIDAILPSFWNDFKDTSRSFIFDFVKNESTSKVKIRTQIMTIKNTNEVNEYEIQDSEKTFLTPHIKITIADKVIGID